VALASRAGEAFFLFTGSVELLRGKCLDLPEWPLKAKIARNKEPGKVGPMASVDGRKLKGPLAV